MKINYKEKRLISEEEKESQDVLFMVEDARLQFEKDLLETKKELAVTQSVLDELMVTYPLDVQAIIDKQIEVENYLDAIRRMEELRNSFGFSYND